MCISEKKKIITGLAKTSRFTMCKVAELKISLFPAQAKTDPSLYIFKAQAMAELE